MTKILRAYIFFADTVNEFIGRVTAWLTSILVVVVCMDVVARYVFKMGSVAIGELEWHLFAATFLLAAGYSLRYDKHVRVDVFYHRFSEKRKAWVNLLGGVFFLIPFCIVIIYNSFIFAQQSYLLNEGSPNPSGLPARYIIKGVIPLGMFFLSIQTVAMVFFCFFGHYWSEKFHFYFFRKRKEVIKMLDGWLEALPLIMFTLALVLMLWGFPVAFTLGGISIFIGLWIYDMKFFYLLSLRIYGIMENTVLMAVPLFVYMGIMLQKSGIAERLLETMALLFGKMKGGLALSVVLVGGMLAASTGVVGATVITMGLISLPTMIKRGYDVSLATGTIAASGTLGQIIPPSVVLVLLGSVMNVSVGDLFSGAFIPGFGLVFLYCLYVIIYTIIKPDSAPAMPAEELKAFRQKGMFSKVLKAFLLPMSLIMAVLGSIFAGIATPTEAAGVGALGATILTVIQGKFSFKVLQDVMQTTTHITTMVFVILIGATAFSLVFRATGGDAYLISLIESADLSPYAFLALVMIIMFVAGFFIDFIEIVFIIVPVVMPTFIAMKLDLIWVGILMAINLQTSFLTPPFGFALFYLKGVCPEGVKTKQIYKGVLPFILIQSVLITLIVIFPEIVTWLPQFLKG